MHSRIIDCAPLRRPESLIELGSVGPSTLTSYPLLHRRMRRRSPRNGIDHSSFGTIGVAAWPLRHLWRALCAGDADGGAARTGARVRSCEVGRRVSGGAG